MSWVKEALRELEAGRPARVRPLGGSMRGRIESGQWVTIVPVDSADVQVDDVVFLRWKGGYLLHLIRELRGDEVLIGNNLGKINGWAPRSAILGKVVEIVEEGHG